MRKKYIFLILLALLFNKLGAQVNVDSNGNVGIGSNISSYNSLLSVGGSGNTEATVCVESKDVYALYSSTTSKTDWAYGLYGRSVGSYRKHVGICGISYEATAQTSGRKFGVLGFAGNATNGWNSGVFGGLGGTQNGGAVVGSVLNPWGLEHAIPGRYAGYFEGPVHSTGVMTAKAFTVVSDSRKKKNIKNLGTERSFQRVLELEPVEYNFSDSQEIDDEVADTLSVLALAKMKETISLDENSFRSHFGLIAQDVQKIYPELVYEDAKGNLSIDYIGLIPLLIQSVQQLNAEVEELRMMNVGISKRMSSLKAATQSGDVYLGQNTPNPFSGECEIAYSLPGLVQVARLYIYDISGREVDSYVLNGRGDNKLIIQGDRLPAGMYIYMLIADGEPVGSHQMIIQ